jgi:hypothetical protein
MIKHSLLEVNEQKAAIISKHHPIKFVEKHKKLTNGRFYKNRY